MDGLDLRSSNNLVLEPLDDRAGVDDRGGGNSGGPSHAGMDEVARYV